jgi:sulfite dehydrogenase (quinone) subunit SoeC
MNRVNSVIFLTVSSGAGYRLLALLGLVGNAHGRASSMTFGLTAMAVALALITTGLLSSSQWRSSWSSRFRVAAIITYPSALGFGCVWSGLVDAPALIAPLGILSALMCAVTVFCEAMIYHSPQTIPAWRSEVSVYLASALATGSGLLNAISFMFGRFQTNAGKFMAFLTVALILIVIALKWFDGSNHNRKLRIVMFTLLGMALLLIIASLILPWLTLIVALLVLAAAWTERLPFFAKAE